MRNHVDEDVVQFRVVHRSDFTLVPVKDEEGNFIMGEVLEEVCNSCRAMMRHPAGFGEFIVGRKPVADEGVVPIPMLVPCWKAKSLRSFTLSGRWSGSCSGRLRLRRLQLRATEGGGSIGVARAGGANHTMHLRAL